MPLAAIFAVPRNRLVSKPSITATAELANLVSTAVQRRLMNSFFVIFDLIPWFASGIVGSPAKVLNPIHRFMSLDRLEITDSYVIRTVNIGIT